MFSHVRSTLAEISKLFRSFLIVGIIITLCALAGIYGRPLTFLAIFWPANAVLLGLFLRFEHLNNKGSWLGAFCGFMLADLITGNQFIMTIFLTIANLIHPFVTLILIRHFKLNHREFNKGLTFVYIFFITVFGGALASALFAIDTIPYVPNSFMLYERIWVEFGMWWTGEILNMVLFLPVMLALPDWKKIKQYLKKRKKSNLKMYNTLPILSLVASLILADYFVGPGTIMFPIGALIWVALIYNLFLIAIINCFVCIILYMIISSYYFGSDSSSYITAALSIRIGLFMLVLGPLTLAVISLNRQKLYRQILYLANHDGLTSALNRRYFFEISEQTINAKQNTHTVSILMLDLDFFKRINDTYGHAVGDKVLQEFTRIVRSQIRADDLFGRIGGEEFALLLKNLTLEQSIEIAQRICKKIYNTTIIVDDNTALTISVSIGLSHQQQPHTTPFQQLIDRADEALYLAKENGRNQFCLEPQLRYR